MKIFIDSFRCPLGTIWTAADHSGVIHLQMPCRGGQRHLQEKLHREYGVDDVSFEQGGAINAQLLLELEAYFSGHPKTFRTPVHPKGTSFQKRVWERVSLIPFGETRSYGQVAAELKNPKGARAVGQANHANPVALVIPCHRVIAGDGKLGGYASGIDKKRWLLQWEKQNRIVLS